MDIFVIRHGIAEDAGSGVADAERSLTGEGVQRMTAVAAALQGLIPEIAVVGHSPLRRARQTAEIVAAPYRDANMVEVEALAPGGDPSALERWARKAGPGPLAVVGHEPDLGRWIVRLLTGAAGGFAPLRKGGVCSLRLDGDPGRGSARLEWLVSPSVLEALQR